MGLFLEKIVYDGTTPPKPEPEPTPEPEMAIVVAESGDNVALDYTLRPPQFQRIRRITGYLVGTLDRFNNAKRAEEHDRVKHGLH